MAFLFTISRMKAFLIRHKKGLIAAAALLVATTLGVYLWLPSFLKSVTEEKLSELLSRQVTIGSVSVAPNELSVTIRNFRIIQADQSNLLHIGNLKANLSIASVAARVPILDELLIESPAIALSRDAKGRLNIADLVKTFAKPSPTPSEPARFAVHNIRLTGGRVDFKDDVAGKIHHLESLAINIPVIANHPTDQKIWTEPHVSGKLNGGVFSIDGKTELFGKRKEATIQLAIQNLDLTGIEKYAGIMPDLSVLSGALSANMDIRFIQEEKNPASVTVSGDLALADFNVLDRISASEIVRGKSVKVSKLQVALNPFAASMDAVDIDGLFFRPTLLPDGRLNLTGAHQEEPKTPTDKAKLNQQQAPAEKEMVAHGSAKMSSAPVQIPGKKLPIDIGKITLTNSSMIFNDQFNKPNFRASVSSLKGSIGKLSAGTKTPVELSGLIDRTAPLKIQGRIDPFNSDIFVDLAVKAKGIEMPPLSSYSIKYLAYPIEKGKLSLDLQYQVEKGQLKANNKIFLDQLTLGERVESPDALSIPVTLAVALLKNTRGEIDINLPISGSINDPQFRIAPIVFKALLNLIVKAATAPFTVLASIFGGGADLSSITFAPGLSRIEPQAEATMAAIAKAMIDRPALKLEITGVASSATDVAGSKRNLLMRRVRAEKASDLASKGTSPTALKDVEVSPDEYPKYLARVYSKADIKKPRNIVGFAKSLPVPEMETRLLESMTVNEGDLMAIADARGRNARTFLANQGVPTERVFVLTSRLEADKDKPIEGKAEFALK